MTTAAVLDLQDEKNEQAAAAWEEVEELECQQAAVRKTEKWLYDQAFKARNVAKAAEDAICYPDLDTDVRADLQYVYDVSRATCQVWLEQAAKSSKKAEALGQEIRSARYWANFKSSQDDQQEGDSPVPLDPQEREALDLAK
jgi:hypothetical protein